MRSLQAKANIDYTIKIYKNNLRKDSKINQTQLLKPRNFKYKTKMRFIYKYNRREKVL